MKLLSLTALFFIFNFTISFGQEEYVEEFNEGLNFYNHLDYSEAYLRFNTAYYLSKDRKSDFAKKCQVYLDSTASFIQIQLQYTDSLLKATKKLTDAFYFYKNRLALAYKNGQYGFINKKGEVEIDYRYSQAENFDEKTGVARVIKDKTSLLLTEDGKEHPITENLNDILHSNSNGTPPKIRETFFPKSLKQFRIEGNNEYHIELKRGIELYDSCKYYDAYLRFNVVSKLTNEPKIINLGLKLKDTAFYEISQLNYQIKKALSISENIINAFYFYNNKFALAFKNGKYGYIDKQGNVKIEYKYEKAYPFHTIGFALVKRNGEFYYIDTTGTENWIDYNVQNLTNITKALDLSDLKLNEFPKEVFEFPKLKIIFINNNNISSLPSGIGNLNNLLYLDVNKNNLTHLPGQINNLTNLRGLNLFGNKLQELPDEIKNCTNLVFLEMGNNQLSNFPLGFGNLTNLKKLGLYGNKLEDFSPEILKLYHLEELRMGFNKIKLLPPAIKNLTNLYFFSIEDNYLNELPNEIGNLKNLTELYLNGNKLKKIPSAFGNLKNLNNLYLNNNELVNFPREITALKNLTELGIESNHLLEIPIEIGNLCNLKELYLNGNQITTIPKEISGLKKLVKLDLSSNKIKSLPSEIGELISLKELILSSNEIGKLPLEIGYLHNLTKLYLSSNKLDTIPNEILRLTNLEGLYLRSNHLTSLPPGIGNLHNLKDLILTGNKLNSVPLEIFELQNLNNLDWREMASQLDSARNYPSAIKCYLKILETDTNNYNVIFETGFCYFQIGDTITYNENLNKCISILQNLNRLNPNDYGYYFDLSWYYLFSNKLQESINSVEKSLSLAPNQTGVYSNLALAYILSNQYEKAQNVYNYWKDKNFPEFGSCKKVFITDIQKLESAGIKHKDFKRIKKLLE